MTTFKTTLSAERHDPGWVMALLWLVAGELGGVLYAIPVGLVQVALGLDRLDGPQRASEIAGWMLVLGAVLCAAACGSTIGLAQWLVLRRQFKRVGSWVAATIVGFAWIGLIPLIMRPFQPNWPTWAFTLIINGKLHWLAREAWPAASWSAGAITLTLFGAAVGFMQWLVLRGRVSQAGWWIVISAACWALAAAAVRMWPDPVISTLTSSFVPVIVAAAGLVWLLRR